MFIKKDLRKIPRILADAAVIDDDADADADAEMPLADGEQTSSKRVKRDILTELPLARRKAEFKGTMKILCQPSNAPSLRKLVSLSVYDCDIKSLDGIGLFGSPVGDGGRHNTSICCPSLETLNVGRNPLTSLPDELGMLGTSLKELWCDDCQITGPLPTCVLALSKLETLNMASNQITQIPPAIQNLVHLKRLCLDANHITYIPEQLTRLTNLEALMLRNNQIQHLPEQINPNLKLLHVSSNQLESLPISLATFCGKLEHLFLNNNRIRHIPIHLPEALPNLKRLNLSNNNIEYLPINFIKRFGEPDPITGLCGNTTNTTQTNDSDNHCMVYIGQNEFNKVNASPVKTSTFPHGPTSLETN